MYAGSTAITSNSSPSMNRCEGPEVGQGFPNWGKSSREDKPANVRKPIAGRRRDSPGRFLDSSKPAFTRHNTHPGRSIDLQLAPKITTHCKAYPKVDE